MKFKIVIKEYCITNPA